LSFLHGDAHVHLHPEFHLPTFLGVARERSRELGAPLLLLLCETAGNGGFAALCEAARDAGSPLRALGLRPTAERHSLALWDGESGGVAAYLVGGRQLVSSEGVEVLALAVAPDDPELAQPDRSLPAATLVRRCLARGAAVVLPWGFGKWIGARSRVVAAIVEDPALRAEPRLRLGDAAHRAWPWPAPRLFERRPGILAGTDLLAVPGAERRLARYGFRLAGELDPERPAASFLAALERGGEVATHGRRESLAAALAEQLRYRARGAARRGGSDA
jgi:hypothetical protein